MLAGFRIDERLIHGQVIATWLKTLAITNLIVANDEVSKDETRKTTLKMVLPSEIKCLIKGVDDVINVLKDPRCESMRILLITGNPEDAYRICKELPFIHEVNLANYGSITKPETKNKKTISKMVYLDAADVESVNRIIDVGIKVFTQKTPSDYARIISKIE
ncbi:MAG: PTS sugar transporter subunit IIB [Erysipelotrichaceae bacterium]|uniref:PTS sugar transporter subunit IIB n=1 Tax=Anaerorhabdus sp. TaxID=1872524 RepID=UPI002FC63BDF